MDDRSSGPRSVARGMYHLFVGNVTSTILLAATAILTGRLLGPQRYGLYSIALITPAYLQAALQLGLTNAAVRFPAKYKSEGDDAGAVSFVYSLTSFEGLVAIGVLALLLPLSVGISEVLFNGPEMVYVVILAATSIVGQLLLSTVSSGFQALGRMDWSAGLQVFQSAVKLVATASLVLAGLGVLGAVGGFTLGLTLAGAAGLVAIARMNGGIRAKGWGSAVVTGIRYSLPLYVGAVATGFVAPFQITLLTRAVSDVQIGGLGAAQSLSTAVVLFTYPIFTALFPLFSGLVHEQKKLAEVYERSVHYSAVFIVPITLLIMSLSSPFTAAVFGRAYSFAGGYLALSVAEYLFVGVGSLAMGALLNALGETRSYLTVNLVYCGGAFLMTPALVPFFGVYGALLALFVGYGASALIGWRIVSRRLGTNVRLSHLWRLYLSSGIAALLVYPISFLGIHPILITLLGGVLFLVLLVPLMLWTGAVTDDDISTLDVYFRRAGPISYLFSVVVRYYHLLERFRNSG